MIKVSIHPDLLLHILYGSPDGRRFTQDTPVLPEVWIRYARDIAMPVQGLIVPRNDHQAHHVAEELHRRIISFRSSRGNENMKKRNGPNIADMPGLITVHCYFEEVVNVVLPLTRWWVTSGMEEVVKLGKRAIAAQTTQAFLHLLAHDPSRPPATSAEDTGFDGNLGRHFWGRRKKKNAEKSDLSLPDSTARVLLVLALIQAAGSGALDGLGRPLEVQGTPVEMLELGHLSDIPADTIGRALTDVLQLKFLRERRTPLSRYFRQMSELQRQSGPSGEVADVGRSRKTLKTRKSFDPRLIFTFSINREGDGAVRDSVKTTKADAARRLFALTNGRITWAVIDSGIDARHHAFKRYSANETFGAVEDWDEFEEPLKREQTRVIARYDMTLISELRNRDRLRNHEELEVLAHQIARRIDLPNEDHGGAGSEEAVLGMLQEACNDLDAERPLNWDLVELITRVRHDQAPPKHHGTHVAGTLGGRWPEVRDGQTVWVEGMCPDINLIDFNVIGGSLKATEFAVIAALRMIRHLNERNDFMVVHGANLSLAIPHDVTNYACGRTPVCVECETLVNSGVVVVAAAGNAGYNVFKTKDRDLPLHTETSIADPGNADAVITVGSTHRLEPHNYGVSYFSSRGPTGDGRMKPDLVAPGEKIDAPICDQQFATLEGTSMAAPHVSGAAALLMARFPELIGNPKRIKQILCESATNLGRERAYQGCGLVDVLRALQSI